ncbi:40S ribosomal protein S15, putative [Babesia bigemina]|uniref:40S ribosomal protein S15, putative n=1 Tax=Babesia bigemina TaxID=5866 RepID=A0A061D048_BABBI|nr:40S ribosomal protein S15, putative [Babesia bigemina]CDR94211.1 40S ribosomal protein S15, putative [Babesia bigemina]|eukprot:XP_012766397.1 40S ribosomal protein S15, putative [Babesia bigemina]
MTDQGAQVNRKRTFRTFKFRGYELEKLLEMPMENFISLLRSRQRRRFSRAKKDLAYGEKPEPVKTHLRDTIIVPEMIGSIVGVYNGKQYINVEIKPEMVGHYVGEFSITYKPVMHGKPGIGATHSSRFIPLK